MSRRSDAGVAMIATAMALALLLALGASLILITSSESAIAGSFRDGGEALYAAHAIVERAIAELRDIGDWSLVLNGTITSALADGAPSGTRPLADGSVLDLSRTLNLANCNRRSTCSDALMNAVTESRPWGVNNPRWRFFAHGRLDTAAGGTAQGAPYYVVALVGDDGAENDGDPWTDGGGSGAIPNPGRRVLLVRGEAFGPRGAHRAVQAVIRAYRMDESDPASPQRVHIRQLTEF